MGKNDVWIAATARVAELTLLTTDADFDHLGEGWVKLVRSETNPGKTNDDAPPERPAPQ